MKQRVLRSNRQSISTIIILSCLVVYSILLISLLGWGVFVSLQKPDKLGQTGLFLSLPIQFDPHYADVFLNLRVTAGPGKFAYFENILGNTLFYSIGSAFFRTIVPCLTAYACARYKFKTSKIIYTTCMIAMMVPIVGSLPSEINVVYAFHIGETQLIMDNLLGTCLLKACMTGLYFFVMYSTFKAMPDDYFEAARIDGAGNWQMLFKIGLPLIKNVFFTVFIINFVEFWNDYQTPLVYLRTKPTLGYLVWKFAITESGHIVNDPAFTSVPYIMTMILISALPVVTLFSIFKDKFMGSLTMGGIKG